jgi:HEPN domain-containing protein
MDSLAQAKEWQRLAAMDLRSAEHLLKMHPVPIEIICYLCQQSAEKYLKGFLVLHGANPPKTHDLDELCKLCLGVSGAFADVVDPCSDLTAYGVQTRYPMGDILEEQDMQQALRSAGTLRNLVLSLAPEMAADAQK